MMAMLSTNAPNILAVLEWSELVLIIGVIRDVTVRISIELVTWLPIFGVNT